MKRDSLARSPQPMSSPVETWSFAATMEILDYALLRLDRSVPDRQPALVRRAAEPLTAGTAVLYAGYPSGLPLKIADGATVQWTRGTDYFGANLDGFPGSSGAGVFVESTGELAGVLARGPGTASDYVQSAEETCARPLRVPDDHPEPIETIYVGNALADLCKLGYEPPLCYCGDGTCDAAGGENSATCAADCGSACGDGACNGAETPDQCYEDCGACGNNRCEPYEAERLTCCRDCGCPAGYACDDFACHPDLGNVNGDAEVDRRDTWSVLASLRGGRANPFHADSADVDCSGAIDTTDVRWIDEVASGAAARFPCAEIADVAVGANHACVLLSSGGVRCWGGNGSGQLGYGNTTPIGDSRTAVAAGLVSLSGLAQKVVAGNLHTCALLKTGQVQCWGSAQFGQLGLGNKNAVGDDELPSQVGVVKLEERAVALEAGGFHTCALLESRRMKCWGDGSSGQLGYGALANIGDDETPSEVGYVGIPEDVAAMAAGVSHTCAVLASGEVRCWGANSAGQLGLGHTRTIGDDELPRAAPVVSLLGPAISVAADFLHTCAVLADGGLQCWGDSSRGQLGYGTFVRVGDDETPSQMGLVPAGGVVKSVALGTLRTCARYDSGEVRCWGSNVRGQLGYEHTRAMRPGDTAASLSTVAVGGATARLSSRGDHTCVLLADGGLRCWGLGAQGALGYGDTANVGDDEVPASRPEVPLFQNAHEDWEWYDPYRLEVLVRQDGGDTRGTSFALVVRNGGTTAIEDFRALYQFQADTACTPVLEDRCTPWSSPSLHPEKGSMLRSLVLDFAGKTLLPGHDTSWGQRRGEQVRLDCAEDASVWTADDDYGASDLRAPGTWSVTDRIQLVDRDGCLIRGWRKR